MRDRNAYSVYVCQGHSQGRAILIHAEHVLSSGYFAMHIIFFINKREVQRP